MKIQNEIAMNLKSVDIYIFSCTKVQQKKMASYIDRKSIDVIDK